MSLLSKKEASAKYLLDPNIPAKAKEINSHELLAKEDDTATNNTPVTKETENPTTKQDKLNEQNNQLTSLSEIMALGNYFVEKKFNKVIATNTKFDLSIFALLEKNPLFMVKIATGNNPNEHYPALLQPIYDQNGKVVDLNLNIVPISYGLFEKIKYEKSSEQLIILGAICASAPHFLLGLESGISTTNCASKKETTGQIKPDHAIPLVSVFDSFLGQENTLNVAQQVAGKPLTLKEATHLHGVSQNIEQTKIISASNDSLIAGGVNIQKIKLSECTKPLAIFLNTNQLTGQLKATSVTEELQTSGLAKLDLAIVAGVLGFTTQVTGNSEREQKVEKILKTSNGDTPMKELLS